MMTFLFCFVSSRLLLDALKYQSALQTKLHVGDPFITTLTKTVLSVSSSVIHPSQKNKNKIKLLHNADIPIPAVGCFCVLKKTPPTRRDD